MADEIIKIDSREFSRGIAALHAATSRAIPEIVNQRAFNVAAKTIDSIKPAPGDEQSTRARIKLYLNQQVSTRIKIFKRGKRKGLFGKAGSRANQLARVNLIIQARREKIGLKGLYGRAMRQAEGKFKLAAQVGVGFLKSAFIPIIKGLHPLVRYKKVNTRWGRISVWPGSKGYGRVQPAKSGFNAVAEMSMRWRVRGTPTKVQGLILPNFEAAIDSESKEMTRHAEERMAEAVKPINST